MRRHLFAAIAALMVAAAAWFAYYQSGRLRVVARPEGTLAGPPVGRDGAVAWIERTGDEDRVVFAPRWRSPRILLSARGIMGVALDGDKALVTRGEGQDAELIAVDLRGGSQRQLAGVKGQAYQVKVGDGVVAWLEERAAAIPAAAFVAAAGPVTVIKTAPEKGGVASLVTVLPEDAAAADMKMAGPGRTQLLGVSGGRVYWLEKQGRDEGGATLVRSAPTTGGKTEAVVAEPGLQQAVLLRDERRASGAPPSGWLVWTSDSLESAISRESRAIKRLSLPGGKPQVVADWLRRNILLMGSGSRSYVQDTELLWRLGTERGQQGVIYRGPGAIQTATVIGDQQYLVLREVSQSRRAKKAPAGSKRGGPPVSRTVIARRPVTWWGRVRGLVGG
jgi:hypothetical protein